MLFTCGQFLFGFRGHLLAVSKQPLPEPSGKITSFHLGLGSRFMVPCSGANGGIFPEMPSAKELARQLRGLELKERKGKKQDQC